MIANSLNFALTTSSGSPASGKETCNDHQFDSLRLVRNLKGVFAAEDEQQLPSQLNRVNLLTAGIYEMPEIQPYAEAGLIKALRDLIQT